MKIGLWFLLAMLVLLPLTGRSQSWVADTLLVNFGSGQAVHQAPFVLDSVFDLRDHDPRQLSIFERKKALFFPVDQLVFANQPVADALTERFSYDSTEVNHYAVKLYAFEIKQVNTSFRRHLVLHSTLEFYAASQTPALLGTFYHEKALQQKKKEPIQDGMEALIDQWSLTLGSDVLAAEQEIDLLVTGQLSHFRRGQKALDKNLYASLEVFAGWDFWGVDAQLWFSEPEAGRIFNRATGIIRYVNHPTFQAIAIGRNVRHWNYRFNEHWLFTHKLAFLIGINNFKDMQTARHTLQEIPLFNLSFTQQLNYNVLDRHGLVAGVGLMEDLHYIIGNRPALKLGATFNLAWKF